MPSKLQYCVYVLLSMHDGNLYVGFTTDLQRRLTEHFHGDSKATAPRRPFRLIFCEHFFSKADAERRESYLKTTAGRKGLSQDPIIFVVSFVDKANEIRQWAVWTHCAARRSETAAFYE